MTTHFLRCAFAALFSAAVTAALGAKAVVRFLVGPCCVQTPYHGRMVDAICGVHPVCMSHILLFSCAIGTMLKGSTGVRPCEVRFDVDGKM